MINAVLAVENPAWITVRTALIMAWHGDNLQNGVADVGAS